jgi:threonine/homoserine/homoserine lactone efflux protein
MLSFLLIGGALGFSAAAQPGPFQAYLVSSTMVRGWRRTLPTVFAPVLSDIPVVGLVLLVLTRIGPRWLDGLRAAGGVFLLYLAAKAWRAFRHYGPLEDASTATVARSAPARHAEAGRRREAWPGSVAAGIAGPTSEAAASRTVLEAATVNLLNPNPYIAWSTVLGPIVIRAWRDAASHAFAFVLAFYATMVGSTVVLVLLLAGARSLGPRVGRALVAASAAALAGFGLYLLWAAARGVGAVFSASGL